MIDAIVFGLYAIAAGCGATAVLLTLNKGRKNDRRN